MGIIVISFLTVFNSFKYEKNFFACFKFGIPDIKQYIIWILSLESLNSFNFLFTESMTIFVVSIFI